MGNQGSAVFQEPEIGVYIQRGNKCDADGTPSFDVNQPAELKVPHQAWLKLTRRVAPHAARLADPNRSAMAWLVALPVVFILLIVGLEPSETAFGIMAMAAGALWVLLFFLIPCCTVRRNRVHEEAIRAVLLELGPAFEVEGYRLSLRQIHTDFTGVCKPANAMVERAIVFAPLEEAGAFAAIVPGAGGTTAMGGGAEAPV